VSLTDTVNESSPRPKVLVDDEREKESNERPRAGGWTKALVLAQRGHSEEIFELRVELGTSHALLIGLDMTDLSAVGTLPSRACHLLGRRLGGALSTVFAAAAFAVLHRLILLLLALLAAFFVLLEASFLFLHAEVGGLVS